MKQSWNYVFSTLSLLKLSRPAPNELFTCIKSLGNIQMGEKQWQRVAKQTTGANLCGNETNAHPQGDHPLRNRKSLS